MKCNACWADIEGQAIATHCGHVFCLDDAKKIISTDSTCPRCEKILSKGNMKAITTNIDDNTSSMLLAGLAPGAIMKCGFKGISFYVGQLEVENQMAVQAAEQSKQMLKQMQDKFMAKMEQVHGALQKSLKQNHVLQKEKESMAKDVSELQQKYAEKARQKRKLEEMYESLRGEYESLKQGVPGSARPSTAAVRGQGAYIPTPDSMELGRKRQNQGRFHIPGLPAPKQGHGVDSPASSGRPFNRPEPSFEGNDVQGFFSTTPSSQANRDNALRNLLLSPALQRPPSRMGARFGQR